MALIDLKSNLRKSNVYKDTPGGGNSGLPYIKQGLPEDSPAGEYLAGVARSSLDVDIRGGSYSTIASTEDTVRISRFLTDFSRGTVFTSKQIGLQKSNPLIETEQRGSTINTRVYSNSNLLAQVANQGTGVHVPRAGFNTNDLLQEQNKYEKIVIQNNNTGQNRLVTLYNSKINLNSNSSNVTSDLDKLGISNDENTLFDYVGGPGSSYGDGNTFIGRAVNTNSSLSTPDVGTIGYLNSLGLTDYIKVNQIGGLVGGLYVSKKPDFISIGASTPSTLNLNSTIDTSNGLGTTANSFSTKNSNFIFTPTTPQKIDFSGGKENIDFEESQFLKTPQPKSLYQQSNPDFIRPEQVPTGVSTINQFGNTMGYSALLAAKGNDLSVTKLQDFRSSSIDGNTLSSDYNSPVVKIESRLKLGDPGARIKSQRKYINQVNEGVGQDKINLLPLYKSTDDPIQTNSVRDMIKFCIEVMDNDNVNSTVPLHFRAYITNLSDNIGAEWDSKRYMGRGENFYTYQGFTREVSFNLKVAAQSKQEMMPLYQKLNYLASSLMPDYNGNGFMRGNLHKLTIGEWFYRTPGVLKSMNISIENDYSWEIKFDEPETGTQVGNTPKVNSFGLSDFQKSVNPSNHKEGNVSKGTPEFQNSNSDADMMELPQMLSINFTFSPILNNLPRLAKGPNGEFTATPILISDHGDTENFIKRVIN